MGEKALLFALIAFWLAVAALAVYLSVHVSVLGPSCSMAEEGRCG